MATIALNVGNFVTICLNISNYPRQHEQILALNLPLQNLKLHLLEHQDLVNQKQPPLIYLVVQFRQVVVGMDYQHSHRRGPWSYCGFGLCPPSMGSIEGGLEGSVCTQFTGAKVSPLSTINISTEGTHEPPCKSSMNVQGLVQQFGFNQTTNGR